MKFLPPNTLAHYDAAPQTHQHDLSDLPTAVFSAATKEYRKTCGTVFPNDEAVTFYVMNHAASIVRKAFTETEPLPAWAVQIMASYSDVTMAQGERLLHYILSISTREMRHLKSNSTASLWTQLKSQWGDKASEYVKNICSNGDEMVAVGKYMNHPPDLTIGAYTRSLAYAFHHGNWSGGYGGHPWGETTDAVVAMVHGTTSMEMLVDTGYTLAHNGGPIFDKGMMYTHYDAHLLTVLDVQRSGQMLDLMLETNANGVKKTPAALTVVELLKKHYPHDAKGVPTFQGFVDWKLVDEMRPAKQKVKHPNKYDKMTVGQVKKSMKTPVAVSATTPLATTLTMHGKKVKVTGQWQVFPHVAVTTFEREK